MAYFSNGTEGMVFDDQCAKCKYGQEACPIALVQGLYNYDAVNNKVATDILDALVRNDGTCEMKELIEAKEPLGDNSLLDTMKLEHIQPNLWRKTPQEIEEFFNQ